MTLIGTMPKRPVLPLPRMLIALAVALVTAVGNPAAQEKTSGTLVVSNYGGLNAERQKKAFYDPFSQDTGVKVVMDQAGGQQVAKLQAQAAAGRVEWSLMTPFDQDAFFLWEKGLLQPLPADIKELAYKAYGANGPKVVSEFGIWRGVSASVFVCNPTVATRCPKNAIEFWNVTDFPGRRALYADGWLENVIYALEADGVARDKLFPLDVDRAYRKLDQLKPHVQVWWRTGDQSQQIFRDKEVAMGVMWDGRAFGLRGQGVPAVVSHDGVMVGGGWWAVPKGAPNTTAAWEFVRWYIRNPRAQAELAALTGYGESPDAINHLPPERRPEIATHPDNLRQSVTPDFKWVNGNRAELVKRWTEWLQK
jgi:mannopine transport system substrate-binding protein